MDTLEYQKADKWFPGARSWGNMTGDKEGDREEVMPKAQLLYTPVPNRISETEFWVK